MGKKYPLHILMLFFGLNVCAQNLIRYVNPFIGTSNSGNTNPGPVMPWGMVSLSPFNTYDTIAASGAASPYHHDGKYIYGFTHLNMSGVGCADMGTFCLMPVTGDLDVKGLNRSAYSHEQAGAGYYSVDLDRYNVRVRLGATPRSGISSFTFPKGQSHILLNMGRGLTSMKGAGIRCVSDTEAEGFKNIGNICGLKTIQTVYFVLRISRRPQSSGVWHDGKIYRHFLREIAGNDVGAFFSFSTQANEQIYVKTGVSYVSIKNARENLQAEQEGFDLKKTKQAAEAAWNKALAVVQVEGGTRDELVQFYTGLYHALIHPNRADDANGEYRRFETEGSGKADGAGRFTVFSLWDTYRSLHPLLSLIYPAKQSAMVRSLIGMSQESGWLPRWEYAAIETGAMTGDPSLPVIADTWLRGIRDFDIKKAYAAMKRNALTPEQYSYMRPGMEQWLRLGFIPEDASNVLHPFDPAPPEANDYACMKEKRIVWGSVSTVLEYCIADWNLAQLAKALGHKDDYRLFMNRSASYKNSFDTSSRFMRPRLQNGNWLTPFDPASHRNNGFTEGSAWNYSFMVPHDIPGLIALMGGPKPFREKLDSCFEQGHFDITNEPDLTYPYLYNYLPGEEWRTSDRLTQLLAKHFSNSAGGLPGNDDCGEISSWLVFTMMGLYPDCPGDMDYQVAIPVFNKISIQLDPKYYPGKMLVIESDRQPGRSSKIKSIEWNGKKRPGFQVNHQELVKGGLLKIITR